MDCCKRGNTRYAAVYWQLGMLDKTLVYQQEVTLDQHRPSSRYKHKGRERDKGWVQGFVSRKNRSMMTFVTKGWRVRAQKVWM